jgi:hypothetical protein
VKMSGGRHAVSAQSGRARSGPRQAAVERTDATPEQLIELISGAGRGVVADGHRVTVQNPSADSFMGGRNGGDPLRARFVGHKLDARGLSKQIAPSFGSYTDDDKDDGPSRGAELKAFSLGTAAERELVSAGASHE